MLVLVNKQKSIFLTEKAKFQRALSEKLKFYFSDNQ